MCELCSLVCWYADCHIRIWLIANEDDEYGVQVSMVTDVAKELDAADYRVKV